MTRRDIQDKYAEVSAEANKVLRDVDRGVIIAIVAEEVGLDCDDVLAVVQDRLEKRAVQ